MLESVLQNAGYKVGIYTSPHLIEYRERIRIEGVNVNTLPLVQAFTAVETARHSIPLTFFEFGTLVALWLFQEAAVEVAILEVGMGGRLDAVNTEVPDVALLTPISLDHEKWLGTNTEKIGREKAGILKFRGRTVINDMNAPNSVIDRARFLQCKYLQYGLDYIEQPAGQYWNWQPRKGGVGLVTAENYLPKPSLPGKHQIVNAAGVIAVLKLLDPKIIVSRRALIAGLKTQSIRGRLEIFRGAPEVIIDVGHNVSAAERLVEFLEEHPVAGRTLGVFSMLKDKPTAGVVERLRGTIKYWHIAELQEDRALSVVELEKVILLSGGSFVRCWGSPQEAFHRAREDAHPVDRIVVFGSAYLVGAILQILDHESAQA
jgi:dihydrofolate synthase/folylpolyglutamate synthase